MSTKRGPLTAPLLLAELEQLRAMAEELTGIKPALINIDNEQTASGMLQLQQAARQRLDRVRIDGELNT